MSSHILNILLAELSCLTVRLEQTRATIRKHRELPYELMLSLNQVRGDPENPVWSICGAQSNLFYLLSNTHLPSFLALYFGRI